MSKDLKRYINREGKESYQNILSSIQNSDKKDECIEKYARAIVTSNMRNYRVNMYKLGFSLCASSSLILMAGTILLSTYHLIDKSYTCPTAIDCAPKIVSSIALGVSVVIFAFMAISAFEHVGYCKQDRDYKDEHRTNLVAADLECAVSKQKSKS